jgi:hypothetical protein
MSMQVFSARVKAGAIVPDEGVELTEGARVTVIADGASEAFDVSPAEEEELLEAIREAESDNVVPAADLLRRLQR